MKNATSVGAMPTANNSTVGRARMPMMGARIQASRLPAPDDFAAFAFCFAGFLAMGP